MRCYNGDVLEMKIGPHATARATCHMMWLTVCTAMAGPLQSFLHDVMGELSHERMKGGKAGLARSVTLGFPQGVQIGLARSVTLGVPEGTCRVGRVGDASVAPKGEGRVSPIGPTRVSLGIAASRVIPLAEACVATWEPTR
jgi:hypothetical protein